MEELDKESPVQEAKEYLVPIKMAGEILEIEEGPLTKAVTNDLYGFQINSKKAGETSYSPYAYGLFDDISNVKIKLISGAEYEFICTMVRDGKNKIDFTSFDGNVSYECPFAGGIENVFVYSTDIKGNHNSLNEGKTALNNHLYSLPNTDRYYGKIDAISPVSATSVSINMKRVVFGLKCIIEGLIEGELNVELNNTYGLGSPVVSIITGGDMSFEDIYTFDSFEEDINGDLSRTYGLKVTHIHADKTQETIVNKSVLFKRNKKTIVTIKVKKDDGDTGTKGVDVVLDDEPMTDGDNVVIDGK